MRCINCRHCGSWDSHNHICHKYDEIIMARRRTTDEWEGLKTCMGDPREEIDSCKIGDFYDGILDKILGLYGGG